MLKFIVGFMLGLMFGCSSHASTDGAPPAPCAPCKIVGAIVEQDGSVVEQFRYPLTFPTQDACFDELHSESFKLAVQDLQTNANKLVIVSKEFQNLKVTAVCAPLGVQRP